MYFKIQHFLTKISKSFLLVPFIKLQMNDPCLRGIITILSMLLRIIYETPDQLLVLSFIHKISYYINMEIVFYDTLADGKYHF